MPLHVLYPLPGSLLLIIDYLKHLLQVLLDVTSPLPSLSFPPSVLSGFSATPWSVAHKASLSFTISPSLLRFMSFESVMLSNHLILCCPLLLLPSVFHSIRVFSSELALCIKWPKYWSFSISPSSEYSGLISFRLFNVDFPLPDPPI